MTKQTRDLSLMLVIGVLIGASGITAWNVRQGVRRADDSSTPVATTAGSDLRGASSARSLSSSSAFPPPPAIPENIRIGLSVADQPGGKTVTVENLSITGTKWIAVYDDHDGKPGWILGASRVHEGDRKTVVELLRSGGTISGETYYAAILNDDGEGEFNRLTDLPPLSPEKVTIVRFRAQ